MKLAIMQPYFFPYIGYFQLINAVDKMLLYGNVTYRKRDWVNRNQLLNKSNGKAFFITAPIQSGSSNKLIKATLLSPDNSWKNKLLKDVYMNYKKATFFDETYPLIERLVSNSAVDLMSYNVDAISNICHYLSINTELLANDIFYTDIENELISENIPASEIKTERIIKLCKKHNATQYINPIGGTELYNKQAFSSKGIALSFIQSMPVEYNQFGNCIPNLSIIDVLMHLGISASQLFLTKYEMV
tara:strand:+ start:138 stop:872 length:735 start_codon:yes stop_codon:yes gene_type:complete